MIFCDSGQNRLPIPDQIRPDIPIIIYTGFSDENDERQAKDMSVKGFLKKPVATGDLATMVRMVLDEANNTAQQ